MPPMPSVAPILNRVYQAACAKGWEADDLLQCLAAQRLLAAQGIEASVDLLSITLSHTDDPDLPMTLLQIGNGLYDMSGHDQTVEGHAQTRLSYFKKMHGLLAQEGEDDIEVDYVAADRTFDDEFAARGPKFQEDIQALVELAASADIPPPAITSGSSTVLVRPNYQKSLENAARARDLPGILALLERWERDQASGCILNFPQIVLEEVACLGPLSTDGPHGVQFQQMSLDIVKRAHAMGANVQVPENSGATLLVRACNSGQEALARYFVEEGVPIEVDDNGSKNSALIPAVSACSFDMVRYLVECGASVDFPEGSYSPLGQAVQRLDMPVFDFLLAQGADPHIRVARRENLLHLLVACKGKTPEKLIMAQRLLDLGVDHRAPDSSGESPVAAARQNQPGLAHFMEVQYQASKLQQQTPTTTAPTRRRTL